MLAERRTIVVGTSYDGGGNQRHQLTWGTHIGANIGDTINQMVPCIDAPYVTSMKFVLVLDSGRTVQPRKVTAA